MCIKDYVHDSKNENHASMKNENKDFPSFTFDLRTKNHNGCVYV